MITQNEIDTNYVDSIQAARLLDVTDARVRKLCLENRFYGALKTGKSWIIPKKSVENFERLRPGKKKRMSNKEIWENAIKNAENLKGRDFYDEQR